MYHSVSHQQIIAGTPRPSGPFMLVAASQINTCTKSTEIFRRDTLGNKLIMERYGPYHYEEKNSGLQCGVTVQQQSSSSLL